MDKYIFPSVFDPAEEGEIGYTVTFPDLPGCITEGDTLEEAMAMAREAMVSGTDMYGVIISMRAEDKQIMGSGNRYAIFLQNRFQVLLG